MAAGAYRTSGTRHESEPAARRAVLPPRATLAGQRGFRGKMCRRQSRRRGSRGIGITGQCAVAPRDSISAAVAGSVHADVDVSQHFLHNKFGGYGVGQERIQFHGLGIVSARKKRVHSVRHELFTNTSVFDMHQRFSHSLTSTTFFKHRKPPVAMTSKKIYMLPLSRGKALGRVRPRRPGQSRAWPHAWRGRQRPRVPKAPGPPRREPLRATPARSARARRRPRPAGKLKAVSTRGTAFSLGKTSGPRRHCRVCRRGPTALRDHG